ncbi:UDP-N-acetylmuramoyl-tripeptide--D-alanyl-D-alanine ligase [Alicyclobacillus hesperidum]|uniref:UDP-N-acetylmuramoyl-tripeptide--D-alanyl-D-alanine ligase n=1 Tax=Alicyclobacillus hesperidum TaxID=89784 RepID=A0AA37X6D1_9BACL|nr:UDP-N-acetylmuramoyl-tripeptide--D-alanyl-D-alanine ligase [Alicyclobacillus hesperidum]GLV12564.1 UDP-N-acetylmuramoyl-tripeptide--D-alanyl-D-alanine ligase [Alicyclobacillus hesperidum]
MTPISVEELCRLLACDDVAGASNALVTGIAVDHREVQPQDAFVAFVGQRVNGHQFVEDAFSRGASVAIVTENVKAAGGSILRVPDALLAVQMMAEHERQQFSGPVVGITGSNGKTTTKEMVAAVLGAMGDCLFTPANRNNELGLPLTILQRQARHRSIVLEMGMRGFGQIQRLCEIAQPTIGVITNIGYSHIELLGSQEGIARAKGELLEALPEHGRGILNRDDPWLCRIASKSRAPITWYGFAKDADVRADGVTWAEDGMHFRVHWRNEERSFHIPTFGVHNVANALAAIAVGLTVGLSLADMVAPLARVEASSGRLRILKGTRLTVIDDCYNASPSSMQASLEVLQHIAPPGQRVAILGDMYELGDHAESGHKEVGEAVGRLGVDRLLAVGKMARWMAEAATAAGVPHVLHIPTVEGALSALPSFLPEEATVLVKASRGMQLERMVAVLSPEMHT